jgi:signal transduction histidine kinase
MYNACKNLFAKIFLLMLIILSGNLHYVCAQDSSKIDSLLSVIPLVSDSSKVKVLLQLSDEYYNFYSEHSIKYAAEALQLSQKINYGYGIVTASNKLAKLYLNKGDVITSLEFNQKALQFLNKINDQHGASDVLFNIGTLYYNLGNYPVALEYTLQSLKIRQLLKNEDEIIGTYNRIASIYARQKDYKNALKYYFKSLKVIQQINTSHKIGSILFSIGNIYFASGDYDSALFYFKKALAKFEEEKSIKGKAYACTRIGVIYSIKGNFNLAEKYFFSSLTLSDSLKDNIEVAKTFNLIADNYNLSGNLNNAINYAEKGLQMGKELGDLVIQKDAMKVLSTLYAKIKDFRKAYYYQTKVNQLADSITNESNTRKIVGIQSSYEVERQNLIIKLKDAELNKQRLIIYISLSGFIVSVFLSIILFKLNREKNKVNALLEQQKNDLSQQQEIINQKNKALSESNSIKDKLFTIIAHDLRSPFWTLKGLIELLNSEDLSVEEFKHLTKRLSNRVESMEILLENLLNWASSQKDGGNFSPEFINIYNLVEENIELAKRAAEEKHITLINYVNKDDRAYADIDMIRLVIRNIITNAVKFTNVNGKIEVKSTSHGNTIEISVCDNGVGIPEENLNNIFKFDSNYSTNGTSGEKGSGLGLGLCKEFVEKNGGKIWVKSTPGLGSTFGFSLNKNKEGLWN